MNGNKGSTAADRWGSPQGPRPMPILPRTQATATSDFKPFGSPSSTTAMAVHNHPSFGPGSSNIKNTARPAVLSVNEQPTDLMSSGRPPNISQLPPQLSLSFTPNSISQTNNGKDKDITKSIQKVELISKSTQGPKSNNVAEPSNGPTIITTNESKIVNKTNHNYQQTISVPSLSVKTVSSNDTSSKPNSTSNQSSSKTQDLSLSHA